MMFLLAHVLLIMVHSITPHFMDSRLNLSVSNEKFKRTIYKRLYILNRSILQSKNIPCRYSVLTAVMLFLTSVSCITHAISAVLNNELIIKQHTQFCVHCFDHQGEMFLCCLNM